jgi:hypothetical protein
LNGGQHGFISFHHNNDKVLGHVIIPEAETKEINRVIEFIMK